MSKKPRVLWHLPYGVIGGTETLYTTILKYMGSDFEHYLTCHVSILGWVQSKYRGKANVRSFQEAKDLALTLKGLSPDVIIGTHGRNLYDALALTETSPPVIEVVHGSHVWVEHNAHMPKEWTKHIICVSNSAERVFRKACPLEIPTSVVINGVDTDVFNVKKPLARHPKVLAYFGRFLECDKHLTKVIGAFKSMGDHHARLHLIGGTPEETVRLKHFIRSQKIEGLVKFFGHTDHPERHYKQVDIATVRSEAEGYCNSVAEALATGTPSVCYNFGGILDHVEPGTILVANSQQDYAKKLREVHQDYNLRKKMRKMGLEFTNSIGNIKRTSASYTKIIQDVLSGKSPRTTLPSKIKKREFTIPYVGKVSLSDHRPVVGVFNPHWHGIATATQGCTDVYVHWNKDPNIMVRNILRHNPRAVLFSGMCPGFDIAIKGIRRQKKELRTFIYYHGGVSHYSFRSGLFGQGESVAFEKILSLQKDGYIEKIAVSAPGLDEVLRVNGYNAQFCGNIRELEELPPLSPLAGFHIGNWNRHYDHKHTTIGIGAGQLIENSVVHCLQGHPIIPGTNLRKIKAYPEMPQEKLFNLYRQMHVNLQMSFIETFNISILEMWAAGRPVIISPSNYILVQGDPLLERFVPKDPTNPKELADLIEKANAYSEEIVEQQFEKLESNNVDSKERWERFFR